MCSVFLNRMIKTISFFFSKQAFVATGTNLQLNFESNAWSDKDEDRIPTREYVDFEREPGKVGNFKSNYGYLTFLKIERKKNQINL